MKKPLSALSKQRIQGQLWLAADIHLGPHAPKTAAAFYAFLKQAAIQADALILCGDIFEAWVGDDVVLQPEPWLIEAIDAFRRCSAEIPLYLMRGNRDFLLGQSFAQQVHAQCLPDEVIVKTDTREFLLAHGDQFCTEDKSYQRYRAIVHHRWVQKLFLSLPLNLRNKIAASLRQRSENKQHYVIGDLYEPSAIELMQQNNLQLLIHGHTHQPAIHSMANTTDLQRIVIPDWEYDHCEPVRGGWVAITPKGGIQLHQHSYPTEMLPSK